MMFLSWAVRCFLWTSILHPCYPRNCTCPDKEGKMYSLESLGSKDRTRPRFSVNGRKYKGYAYSYNPCRAFHLGPKNSHCKRNVAICRWVPNLKQSAYAYEEIGVHRGVDCDLDADMPVFVYQASEYVPVETYETFQLTHFWDSCQRQDREPSSSVPVVVAGTVGGVCSLALLIYAVWYCKKKRHANNDNDEGQRILQANVIHNPIEGLNPASRSRPSPIGSSHAKPDVNVTGSVYC